MMNTKHLDEEIYQITGLRPSAKSPKRVKLDAVLGKMVDELIIGAPLKPTFKAKLEGFLKGYYHPVPLDEFLLLDDIKADLERQWKYAHGLYDREEGQTYIIQDKIARFKPWFRGMFRERAEDELKKYTDLIYVHEKVHEAHLTNCERFSHQLAELGPKRATIINDLKRLYRQLRAAYGRAGLAFPFFIEWELEPALRQIKARIAQKEAELEEIDRQRMGCNILMEALAHYTVMRFCERNPAYEDVGKVYELLHLLHRGNLLAPRNRAGVKVMQRIYSRYDRQLIIEDLLNRLPDRERCEKLIQKVREEAAPRRLPWYIPLSQLL
jgi:hypothetical protein